MSPLGDSFISPILGEISPSLKYLDGLEVLFGVPPSHPCMGKGLEPGQPCRGDIDFLPQCDFRQNSACIQEDVINPML